MTIECPHCFSNDIAVIHQHASYIYLSQPILLRPYVCLDCGVVFIEKEDYKRPKRQKEREG